MLLQNPASVDDWMQASRMRNFKIHSLYRLFIAATLLVSQLISNGSHNKQIILTILAGYFLFSCASAFLQWSQQAINARLHVIQNCIDIAFIILVMHFYYENQSGVGLLLIISIVFSSLISDGRYALFYAAFASLGILAEETYDVLWLGQPQSYLNAGMLCFTCFATAWLAYTLAKRMQTTERLASEREIDLLNLFGRFI